MVRRALLGALALGGCCFTPVDHGRGTETVPCTPGQAIVIGCDRTVGTPCTGSPTLLVCDGAADGCPPSGDTWSVAGHSDPRVLGSHSGPDHNGLCPVIETTCPASGTVTVRPRPFHSEILAESAYTCDWALGPR